MASSSSSKKTILDYTEEELKTLTVTALQGCGSGVWGFKVCSKRKQGDQLLVIVQALNVDCALSFKGHEVNGR